MPLINPNAYTGNPLERLSEKRGDEAWVADRLADPNGRLVLFWKGKPLIDPARREPLWLTPAAIEKMPAPAAHVLLGFLDGVPYAAVDASTAAEPPFEDLGTCMPLRETGDFLGREDLAILGQAAWLLDWHRRHQFCPRTGKPTVSRAGGLRRLEPESGTEHYPRVDPVAIVLPVHGDQCLLGRSPHFPPNMFSALAGFVEPGETLEECAIREIREEAGVTMTEVDYIFSQPWPFPSSLMFGFIGTANSLEVTPDPEEIEELRWVDRGTMARLLDGELQEGLFMPPRYAIARRLMEHWVAG